MSNRKSVFTQPQLNPATKFINWKSNDKCFSYFDKNLAETLANEGKTKEEIKELSQVKIQLPFKFLVLDELASVKGWSDSLNGQIISNEVKYISKEPLTIKCYHRNAKGESVSTEIAKGIYKDVKEKVNSAGAKYHKSLYVMLEDGTLANIKMKGAVVQQWGVFTQRTKNRLTEEWVIVEKHVDGKKGAVKFTTPDFKFERSISNSESEKADEVFDVLEAYLKTYLAKSEIVIEQDYNITDNEDDDDDLEF